MPETLPDLVCDVLVVGSGAGGLSAAITARKGGADVHVVEKESLLGGTTARSGGVLWIPGNAVNARAGVTDSPDAARTYMAGEAGAFFDADRVEAFLENGPRMVDFFEAETAVRFMPNAAFPDYHPDAPGAVPGGRSIVAAPLFGQELGARIGALRPPLREITFVGMMFNASQEVQHFFRATKSLKSFLYVMRRLAAHAVEMAVHGRPMRLTNGNALAARLAKSAFNLSIPVHLSTAAWELTMEDGRVTGALVEGPEGTRRIRARRGVVLACGGFPRDRQRISRLFPHAPTGTEHLSPAPDGNTGDGLRLAESAGAAIEEGLPNAAAWIPVSRIRYRDGTVGHFPHLIDRYKPGIICVLRDGRRFVNEAQSYHDVGQAMIGACRGAAETAAWLVCDHTALSTYGMGFAKPFPVPRAHLLRSGYLVRGRTLAELARKAGIDPAGLERTVAAFNGPAREGRDPAFGKGTSVYNRFLGDAAHAPNPCVAPIARGPFYAIKIVLGDLGTFAGIKADHNAQALDRDGRPIPGLFTAGNDMASIMGGAYPGGGITLGPAMTFGYIAGRILSGADARPERAPAFADATPPKTNQAAETYAHGRQQAS